MRLRMLNLLSLILFTGIIILPIIDHFIPLSPKIQVIENRHLGSFPRIGFKLRSLLDFPKQFDTYYNDNFGFRNSLIFLNSLFHYSVFKDSTNPRVAIGENGWLYLRDGEQDIRGLAPFKRDEKKQWLNTFKSRHNWLKSKGIRYLVIFCPSKSTMYPDNLPKYMRKMGSQHRLSEIQSELESSGVDIVTVENELKKSSAYFQTYYKKDLHWNNYGGFIAAQEVLRVLGREMKELKPYQAHEIDIYAESDVRYPDLAGLLSLQNYLGYDNDVRIRPKYDSSLTNNNILFHMPGIDTRIYSSRESPITATVFHDSFGTSPVYYLGKKFGRIYAIEGASLPFFPEIIEREAPKVVLEFILEAKLSTLPDNTAIDSNYNLRADSFWHNEYDKGISDSSFRYTPQRENSVPSNTKAVKIMTGNTSDNYIMKFDIETTSKTNVSIAVLSIDNDGTEKRNLIVREISDAIRCIYVPVSGNGIISNLIFKVLEADSHITKISLAGVKYRQIESKDNTDIMSNMANTYSDGWTLTDFGYISRKRFKTLKLKFWAPGANTPNRLIVLLDNRQFHFDVKAGSQEINLPYSNQYNFKLDKAFKPNDHHMGEDNRELGVRIESIETI